MTPREQRLDFARTVDDWLVTMRAQHVRERTIDAYRRTLYAAIDVLGEQRDPRTLTLDDYEVALAAWQPRVEPNTLHNRAMALRSFDRWLAARRGGRGQARHLAPIRRTQTEPRRLTDRDVAAVLRACRTSRDRAIVTLLGPLAFRNHEARSLLVQDVDIDEAIIVLPEGKGGHGRIVPLGPASRDALARHLADLDTAGHAHRRHYLVCRRHEGIGPDIDLKPWEPLGHTALNRAVARLARDAGLADPVQVTPHMFRRWALEAFIAETGDLHAAAELAGHRDVNQTRRYAGRAKLGRTRIGVAAIEAAIVHHSRPAAIRGMGAPGIEPGASRSIPAPRDSAGHEQGA